MNVEISLETASGTARVHLAEALDGAREEQARLEAHQWIKSLRHAEVGGQAMRRRFTFRGDSLWWFTELYLHKREVVLGIFRLIAALDHAGSRERATAVRLVSGGRVAQHVVRAFAAARGLAFDGPSAPGDRLRLARMDAHARALTYAAYASRLKPRAAPAGGGAIAAFVHTAFWRAGSDEGSAESYIGPVLTALERRLGADQVRYVGVGPSDNFRARRWWHPLRLSSKADAILPVEAFASLRALEPSRGVWTSRHRSRSALWSSRDLRARAVIHGCDCWAVVREELAGVALLQWPWSARAMDEAGAALDALRPGAAVTYAEAGGWGRAIVLEARRRGIASVGLQHGFIYRHWLNYLHEPDEMAADEAGPGFPHPTRTLLFDRYAHDHLASAGHFPPGSLAVTGSPRLDALARDVAGLDASARAAARRHAGARDDQALVVLVAKHREARGALPSLVAAVAARPDVHLAIKTHPAETPGVYTEAAGHANVRVLPPDAALAPLLAVSRAVVTVNSTVALDAAVLGVPALVIGLPNNLSPFVVAGVMAGAGSAEAVGPALTQILYDDGFRLQLDRHRRDFLARVAMAADGRAAERSADAIAALLGGAHSGE